MENFQMQLPDYQPKHQPEFLPMSDIKHEKDPEEARKELISQITEQVAYRYDNGRRRPIEAIVGFENTIDELPTDALFAINEYLEDRESNMFNGLTSGSYNEKVRISDVNRRKKHEAAGERLVAFDPERFPDVETAMHWITSLTENSVSRLIADYRRE